MPEGRNRDTTMDTKRQDILWGNRQIKRATDESYMANRPRLNRIVAAVDKLTRPGGKDPTRILNIGAGDARLEGMLQDKGYEVYLLDPSQSIVEFVRDKYSLGEDKVRCGWSQDIPFEDGKFDFVVMTEVVEHLDDDVMHQTFGEVRRVLKTGGYFLGTVPDNEDLSANTFRCLHCGEVSHRVGHESVFTAPTLREELQKYFEVDQVASFRGMYMNWKGVLYHHWIDLPYKIARMIKPRVRAPHQIVFNLFFVSRKV